MLARFWFFLCIAIYAKAQYKNNVCSSLEAYFKNIATNPKCWYDPDIDGTPQELAKNNGFLLEEHQVTTKDGYLLALHRLKNLDGSYGSQVVFLQHGMTSSSICFMMNKENSISFYLARKGFDVWLGNFRGCEYCSHKSLTSSDLEYWNFSFHENGLFDLPAHFQYINHLTKQKIIFIGHSMGTTGLLIYASKNPTEAKKFIKHSILLSPAIFFKHSRGLVSKAIINNLSNLVRIFPAMGYNALMQKDSFELLALRRFCFSSLDNARHCQDIFTGSFGPFIHPQEPEKFPLLFSSIKSVSVKSIMHYIQSIVTGEFRMYDYGSHKNMLQYGKEIPPVYDLSNVTISVSMVYGVYDNMATKEVSLRFFEPWWKKPSPLYLFPTEDVVSVYQRYNKPNWDLFEIPHNHIDILFSRVVKKTLLPLLSKIIVKVIKK